MNEQAKPIYPTLEWSVVAKPARKLRISDVAQTINFIEEKTGLRACRVRDFRIIHQLIINQNLN